MKKLSWFIGIAGMSILMLFLGCGAAGRQFKDGLAVVSGRGGRVAHKDKDAFEKTVEQANILNKDQPLAQWASIIKGEGADLISFLDQDRVLVGTAESGAHLGVPKHGDIRLINTRSGDVLWSAGRKGLKNGQYFLLLTEPLIVIVGREHDASRFTAYDPENGRKKWNHKIKGPNQIMVNDAMDRILLCSSKDDGRKVEALDVLTGDVVWSRELPSDAFSPDIPDYMEPGLKSLFVIGVKIFKLSEKNGDILWSIAHPVLNAKDRSVSLTPEGLLIYNSKDMALIHQNKGAVRWDVSFKDYIIISATVLNHKVYRAIAKKNRAGEAVSGHYIQALAAKNGKVLWSKRIKGEVVSPLCLEKNILTLTTNNGIYGLKAKTGKLHFYHAFSKAFISGCPGNAKTLKRPDMIRFRPGKLYVAREMAGIRAYAYPSGKFLWEQLQFNYSSRGYSADRVSTYMKSEYFSKTVDPAAGPGLVSTSTSSNPFMQSAQRQYEDMRERTGAVLSDQSSTRADRQAAQQERGMRASLMESKMKTSMAMGKMQSAVDLAFSIMNLGAAIQSTYARTAIEGAITRTNMHLNILLGLPRASFQGHYYLWPFYDEGRGVTLIDLVTGNRNDLIFSPRVFALDSYGLDLPSFTLGPDGKTLVMAGLGLNPEKYEKTTKWNTRIPKSSVLAYDVSGFDFRKKSLTQIRAEEREKQMQQLGLEIHETNRIHTSAQMGNMDLVKSLLDSGVDVNAKTYDGDCGPLVFAVIGIQVEMVRFLISRGADVNERTKQGRSVLSFTDNEEIIKMLKEAGAK